MNFDIVFAGKARIEYADYAQHRVKRDSNWWTLRLKNGPSSFVIHVPLSRDASVTKTYRQLFAKGNFISFEVTPTADGLVALKVRAEIEPHQGVLFEDDRESA